MREETHFRRPKVQRSERLVTSLFTRVSASIHSKQRGPTPSPRTCVEHLINRWATSGVPVSLDLSIAAMEKSEGNEANTASNEDNGAVGGGTTNHTGPSDALGISRRASLGLEALFGRRPSGFAVSMGKWNSRSVVLCGIH